MKIDLNIGGHDFTFLVEFEADEDAGAPWEVDESHGVVSDWVTRPKRPSEVVLRRTRYSVIYYDFAASVKRARMEGWDDGEGGTKGERAVRAVLNDIEVLRAWCNGDWGYVGVIVTLLGPDGSKTDVSDSLWAIETLGDYHIEQARLIADELLGGYGVSWGDVAKATYGAL